MFKSVKRCRDVPFLHETFASTRWLQHLCPELQVALTAMMTVEPIKVAQLGITNVKDPALVCVLDRAPSAAALAAAKRATGSYKLNHLDDAIGCPAHRERIDWAAVTPEETAEPSLTGRLRTLVSRGR